MRFTAALIVGAGLVLVAHAPAQTKGVKKQDVPVPLGLLPVPWPEDNPYSREKAELGRLLYFDKRLSADATVKGGRSAPITINRAYSLAQFWDGRASTLEDQAKCPIQNPTEMGETHATMVAKLNRVDGY